MVETVAAFKLKSGKKQHADHASELIKVAICPERRNKTADMENMPKAILPDPHSVKNK